MNHASSRFLTFRHNTRKKKFYIVNWLRISQSVHSCFKYINESKPLYYCILTVLRLSVCIPVPEACTIPDVSSDQSLQGRQSGTT